MPNTNTGQWPLAVSQRFAFDSRPWHMPAICPTKLVELKEGIPPEHWQGQRSVSVLIALIERATQSCHCLHARSILVDRASPALRRRSAWADLDIGALGSP